MNIDMDGVYQAGIELSFLEDTTITTITTRRGISDVR